MMNKADAHFIRPLKNLQIEVTFQKTRFKAVCSAFPECKGFGKDEDEAVNKLCKSISKFISQVASGLVESVIREAMQHPVLTEDDTDQAYPSLPAESPLGVDKRASNPFAKLRYPEEPYRTKVPPEQDIHRLIERLHGAIEEPPTHSEIEGFYMGFPLSLN